jgi:putative transposase
MRLTFNPHCSLLDPQSRSREQTGISHQSQVVQKNRHQARLNLARKHRKIANQRHDFHWKLANTISDDYDMTTSSSRI